MAILLFIKYSVWRPDSFNKSLSSMVDLLVYLAPHLYSASQWFRRYFPGGYEPYKWASNEYYLAYRNFQWFVLHVAHVSSPFAWVMISTWPGPPDSESSYNLYKSIKAEKIAVSSVSLMKDLLSWQAANLNNCLRQTSGIFWLMWFELD